jgi:hypothetical protein
MSGKIAAALILLFSVSCAKPNYVSTNPGTGQGKISSDQCQAKFTSGECVSLSWEKMPGDSFGSFVFKTFRANLADGSPVPLDMSAQPSILLLMPDMGGMQGPPVTVNHLDTGTYRASNVFFSMRGKWAIHFQIKDENTVRDEAVLLLDF